MIYGLVAPGYEMADVVARNLASLNVSEGGASFAGFDMSTKLKLIALMLQVLEIRFCMEMM
jgi:nitrite reductase (NADH) large subunit